MNDPQREPPLTLALSPKGRGDWEFIAALESCTLPSEDFDHRAHVRLAWLYLSAEPLLEALPRFIASLKRYAGSLGASGKYHETITYAFIFLIHERMAEQTAATFGEFAAANPDLFGPILQKYYERETLASPLARTVFVLPTKSFVDVTKPFV
jgi:hypothetical protein